MNKRKIFLALKESKKFQALIMFVVSTISFVAILYYNPDGIFGILLMLIALFVLFPMLIASLYVLTNGWIFWAFMGPGDLLTPGVAEMVYKEHKELKEMK